ncbi:MAG: hypothetical protein WC428_05780 [Candidatus Paceibacterota bacterium]|jgi:ABC-type phosphate transport system auxiliary subunit
MKNLFYLALGVFLGYKYQGDIKQLLSGLSKPQKLPSPAEEIRQLALRVIDSIQISDLPTTNKNVDYVRQDFNTYISQYIVKEIPYSDTYVNLLKNARNMIANLSINDLTYYSTDKITNLTTENIERIINTTNISDTVTHFKESHISSIFNAEQEALLQQQQIATQQQIEYDRNQLQLAKERQALQTEYASLEDCNINKFNSSCVCRPYKKAVSGGSGILQPTFYKMDCTKITLPIN